jgi:hypothetical protein
MKTYIQIEDHKPFRAELLDGTGVIFGKREGTQPIDEVRGFMPVTHVARAHYEYKDGNRYYENDMYYHIGLWKCIGRNGICFCVREPIF